MRDSSKSILITPFLWGIRGPYWIPYQPHLGGSKFPALTVFFVFSTNSLQYLSSFSLTHLLTVLIRLWWNSKFSWLHRKPLKCSPRLWAQEVLSSYCSLNPLAQLEMLLTGCVLCLGNVWRRYRQLLAGFALKLSDRKLILRIWGQRTSYGFCCVYVCDVWKGHSSK